MSDLLEKYELDFEDKIKLVPGGKNRNDTIFNIINDIEKTYGESEDNIIVPHDAVRPFVTLRILDENIENADLLKSYHLREMSNDNLDLKLSLVGVWEKVNQKKLALFFQNHLYPLTTWYKGKSGLNYSSKHIKTFKGLKQDNKYNYAIYHKAANLYIEHFNSDNMFELTCSNEINQFQLTQPVVAGRRFFSYTLYYLNMYEKVCSIIEKEFDGPNVKDIVRDTYGGNGYIRNLFINIIMFYIDKFDFDSLSKTVLKKLFKWAYSLRLKMYSVYPETVNNYALGNNNRANYGLRMFNKISEMTSPSDMDSILLDTIKKNEINNKNDLNTRLWTEIFGGQNE